MDKYVYWFVGNESIEEILKNIYIIIFLYVIGYFILKLLMIVKEKRRR